MIDDDILFILNKKTRCAIEHVNRYTERAQPITGILPIVWHVGKGIARKPVVVILQIFL